MLGALDDDGAGSVRGRSLTALAVSAVVAGGRGALGLLFSGAAESGGVGTLEADGVIAGSRGRGTRDAWLSDSRAELVDRECAGFVNGFGVAGAELGADSMWTEEAREVGVTVTTNAGSANGRGVWRPWASS